MMNPYIGYRMPLLLVLIVVLWTLFWKGYAIWTAVKNNQKGWFVALLIFNTVGILEIIYIFCVAKKKWSDVKRVFLGIFSHKKTPKQKEVPQEPVN